MELLDYGFVDVGNWKEASPWAGRILKSGIHYELDPAIASIRAIYAFVVDDIVKYIGICDADASTMSSRMDKYRYRTGGSTNRENASRLLKCLSDGKTVRIHALTPVAGCSYSDLDVDLVRGLEYPLIAQFRPEWNIRGRQHRS